ncbi:MAG: O-antigen ligase family protein, partial [Pseudomonadota bacterium]
ETVILLFAATFLLDVRHAPRFLQVAPVTPLLIILLLGIVRLALGIQEHGIWAARDASHMLTMLYIWIGFVVASAPGFLDFFTRALRAMALAGLVYALGYPIRDTLSGLSPTITAPAGYTMPLMFNYVSGSIWSMTAGVNLLLARRPVFGLPATVVAGGLILYCIVIYQMRSSYLQFAAILCLLIAFRPQAVGRLSIGGIIGIFVLMLVLVSGVEITGRLGEKFSLEFLSKHLLSIVGIGAGGEDIVAGAASGFTQRLGWWTKIFNDLTSDPVRLLFGLGYGIPLTDFVNNEGALVREPHNSTISFTARLGLVGLIAFVWLQAVLLVRWLKLYRFVRRQGDFDFQVAMLTVMALAASIWMFSIGEDAFEKPFNSVPYYFFFGVMLRAYAMAMETARDPAGRAAPESRTVPA